MRPSARLSSRFTITRSAGRAPDSRLASGRVPPAFAPPACSSAAEPEAAKRRASSTGARALTLKAASSPAAVKPASVSSGNTEALFTRISIGTRLRPSLVPKSLDLAGVAEVRAHGPGAHAQAAQLGSRLLGFRRAAPVVHQDVSPFPRQRLGDGLAQAAGRPGHQRRASP